jgi:hypothetical protein
VVEPWVVETTSASVARQDVRQWWRDCVDGRRSRLETSEWAEDQLARSDATQAGEVRCHDDEDVEDALRG